jgi:predicted nucleic acid-binding protein
LSCYLDTSALFSLYVPDPNAISAAAKASIASRPLLCSDFLQFEFNNALALRIFRRELSAPDVKSVLDQFRKDLDTGTLRSAALPSTVFRQALEIASQYTPRHGSRSLDVLHVASALVLGANQFLSFDQRQTELASSVGLAVL